MASSALNYLVQRLGEPLSDEDAAAGWTAKSKAAIANAVDQLNAGSKNERVISRSMVRGMDHWGISSGALFELVLGACRNS